MPKTAPHHLSKLLAALIVLDLLFFGALITDDDFRKVSAIVPDLSIPAEYNNTRILVLDESYHSNLPLYYKHWGLIGYSQLTPDNLNKRMVESGFLTSRHPTFKKSLIRPGFGQSTVGTCRAFGSSGYIL